MDRFSYMGTTSSPDANARTTGSTKRSSKNIGAVASDIYPGGQSSPTRADASATGNKSRSLDIINAAAPGIYPGDQYSTTNDASAIYTPAWKVDPYPVY